MKAHAEVAVLPSHSASDPVSLPAGAGIALAVLIGSLVWIGVFALMM